MAYDVETTGDRPQSVGRKVLAYWRLYVIILIPLAFLPLPIIFPSAKMNCAYMIIIMAFYWVTEALPLAVTSLLPLVLAPALGIVPAKNVSPNYTKDTIMLFMGGLMVAVCVEHWNLHKRIALKVLSLVGTSPRWLMLGFMLPTWFLSMWISNTATTAMMIPIASAVLEQIRVKEKVNVEASQEFTDITTVDNDDLKGQNGDNIGMETHTNGTDGRGFTRVEEKVNLAQGEAEKKKKDLAYKKFCKAMSLCVAYAANCGGIATLTGTPPNLVFKGQIDLLFGDRNGVDFPTWMGFAFPVSFLSLFVGWVWLQILFLGCRDTFGRCCKKSNVSKAIKGVLRDEYKKLGPWTFAEIGVLCCFIILALLWLSRAPGSQPGWGSLFKKGYVSDSTAAMVITFLLFVIPSKLPSCCGEGKAPAPSLLNWDIITHKLPWNVVLLLGGGFAMAHASQVSGLSAWVGEQLVVLRIFHPALIVLFISTIIAALTEVTSNTATATLMLPIIADLAINLRLNPLFLMLPATISASFAFMLPVATPPNAIVFSYGHLRIKDMALAGSLMNIICILIVTLAVTTWGTAIFSLDTFPDWANKTLTSAPPATTMVPGLNCTV